jgi:hypothetical protein
MYKKKLIMLVIISFIMSCPLLAFSKNTESPDSDEKKEKKIEFSGYVQAWAKTDFMEESTSSTFLIKRARLTAKSSLSSRVSIKLMVDFAKTENVLHDAYADIKITDSVYLRFGQHKTPFSRINLRSGSDLYLTERTFYQEYLTPQIRDIGFYASYNKTKFQLIGGIYNGEGRTKADSDGIKHISLRGVLKAIPNLDIAANIYVSHKEVGLEGGHLKIYGVDFHYEFSQFFLEGEIVKKQVSLAGQVAGTGGYLMCGGQFNRKGTIRVEPVIRYEYLDAEAPISGLQKSQVLGGVNLYNEAGNVKLSLNAGHIDGGTYGVSYNKACLQLQLSF